MNYVITGSLGHISKPIVTELARQGHHVTVITSKIDNVAAIEALGAHAAVGSVDDSAFISKTFAGADAVYLMIPPNWNPTDWYPYQQQVADNYVAAVQSNGVRHVVVLSSIGAHMRKGAGPIDGLGYLEEQLEKLTDVNALFLRPSYFFYNLFNQVGIVKSAGIFGGNYGGEEKLVLVDTEDIAAAAIAALSSLSFKGHSVQYIASDERTTDEIAAALGAAIGKPGTPWIVFTDEQQLQGALQAGLSQTIAEGYTQMGRSIRTGQIQEDYWKNRPAQLGKLKLEEFAKAFAAAYQQS